MKTLTVHSLLVDEQYLIQSLKVSGNVIMDESALERYFDKYIANDNWRTEQEEVTEEKQEEVTEEKQEEVTEEKQEELTEGEELFLNLLPDELLMLFPSDNAAESRTADNWRTEQEEVTEEKQEEVTEEKQEELTEEEELFLKLLPDELLMLFPSDNTAESRTADNWRTEQEEVTEEKQEEVTEEKQEELTEEEKQEEVTEEKQEPEILRLPKPTPVICNVFSTVNLGCRLDLHSIARNMWNVEYNPKSFKGLIMRNRAPKATVIMFASGKMTCFVRESIMMARLMARRFARKLQKFGFPVRFLNFKIQNLMATYKAFPVDLKTLCEICKWECSYDPLKFSGLSCKVNPRIKVTVFSTGRINLTGAKSPNELNEALEAILPFMRQCRKQ
ncbi:TATA-box-binding protein-like [Archocentrus centrarchus]|uniref:TATA-box-binding protein-like n=1 Tax=Archocentrus centrarchus TaxID=63155 RepID=UPI0011EA1BB7|nr:TATA-box-binding protein-like [Archocentrus centrarchus]